MLYIAKIKTHLCLQKKKMKNKNQLNNFIFFSLQRVILAHASCGRNPQKCIRECSPVIVKPKLYKKKKQQQTLCAKIKSLQTKKYLSKIMLSSQSVFCTYSYKKYI